MQSGQKDFQLYRSRTESIVIHERTRKLKVNIELVNWQNLAIHLSTQYTKPLGSGYPLLNFGIRYSVINTMAGKPKCGILGIHEVEGNK